MMTPDLPAPWLFELAAAEARKSLCLRSSCGAVLVKDYDTVLGSGYNGPPCDDLSHRVCGNTAPSLGKPKSDRTCCVHAEWRALLAALKASPGDLAQATMVFARVDAAGQLKRSGKPYCTVCSRLTLDAGVGFWSLWHQDGIRLYRADEYHRLSERYDAPDAG
jgi:deoxycytidylate deaminase